MPGWVYTYIAVGVSTVWFLAQVVALLATGQPNSDPTFNAPMGVLVGALFGARSIAEHGKRYRKVMERD